MDLRGLGPTVRQAASALEDLVVTQFPDDHLQLVAFAHLARELRRDQLPELAWNDADWGQGSCLQAAMSLAVALLGHRPEPVRQILLLTDGEPTAYLAPGTTVQHYASPPNAQAVQVTIEEATKCAQGGIAVHLFVAGATPTADRFVANVAGAKVGGVIRTRSVNLEAHLIEHYRQDRGGHPPG
jgi:uncharacterized protein with von Willebrand factor type A (vWA) domain